MGYTEAIATLNQVRQQLLIDHATSNDARQVGYLTNAIGNLDRSILNLIFARNQQEREAQNSAASPSED